MRKGQGIRMTSLAHNEHPSKSGYRDGNESEPSPVGPVPHSAPTPRRGKPRGRLTTGWGGDWKCLTH